MREDEGVGAGTVDVGSEGAFVRVALLPCLTDRFRVVRDLGAGGEPDVLLVADATGERQWVVKQYRQRGWSPSMDVLDLLDDLKVGQSPNSWASDERLRHVVWLQELQEWGNDPATGQYPHPLTVHRTPYLAADLDSDLAADLDSA